MFSGWPKIGDAGFAASGVKPAHSHAMIAASRPKASAIISGGKTKATVRNAANNNNAVMIRALSILDIVDDGA